MSAIDLTFDNANQHLAAATENRSPLASNMVRLWNQRPVIGANIAMSNIRRPERRG